jgi:hypothetical protein
MGKLLSGITVAVVSLVLAAPAADAKRASKSSARATCSGQLINIHAHIGTIPINICV